MRSVLVHIHGKVQGVWYRGWTVEQARALGLTGWVRNRSDGTVEAVFTGGAVQVAEMLRLCDEGPTHARVSKIDVTEAEPCHDPFGQRPSV